jgi:hypothetical protein
LLFCYQHILFEKGDRVMSADPFDLKKDGLTDEKGVLLEGVQLINENSAGLNFPMVGKPAYQRIVNDPKLKKEYMDAMNTGVDKK